MSTVATWIGAALVFIAALVTTLGTLGLFRFPDALSRLHALTKVDNVGLGLCVLGLALIGRDPAAAVVNVLIWLGVMLAGSTAAHLMARRELERQETGNER